jgi:O-antigen ligase
VRPALRTFWLDWLLLATVVVTTWAKIHWQPAGQVTLEDIFAAAFVALFVWDRIVRRDARMHPVAGTLALIGLGLEVVYLAGFFDLPTHQALDQYAKGMAKFLIHFGFLVCAAAHVLRRGRTLYWRTFAALIGGIVLNAVYGVFQLAAKVALGLNLDKAVVGPLTFGQGGVGGINVYGEVSGKGASAFTTQGVFRINALALDPNHLGIMLDVPILLLLPFALREGMRTRRGLQLWVLVAFLAAVQLATLSRSGYFGLVFGLLVLAIPLRREIFSPRVITVVGIALLLLAVVISRSHYAEQVFKSRFTASDRSAQVHYQIFALVPPILQDHPLLGLGLNTFSVYYQFQTGRTDWGPHSFYVALLAETGLIGTVAFLAFVAWMFVRLAVLHRALALMRRAGDPEEARAGPLLYGLTAALVATLAANVFYLTMQFYYFYALVLLIAATPVFFAPAAERVRARARVAPAGGPVPTTT